MRKTFQRVGTALALILAAGAVPGQDWIARKQLVIPRVEDAPVLDGVLDDAAWENALVIEDMHQFLPVDHGVPSEKSGFYLMYDDDNLYIGARLWDSEPEKIYARQLIQGQSLQFDDAFEFILDPFNNMRTGYQFQLNPNSVRLDGVFEDTRTLNRDWDGIWDGEARIGPDGWTAEVAIPFKTLNFDPANPNWGFTIARTIARKKEEIAWSSYDRSLNPGTTGILSGFTGLKQGMGLDLVPSISVGTDRNYALSDYDGIIEPSLDVFYKFTPSLTGVLTFNTDFSDTDVDDRQVNLSRFSLFFPEKRDFFLQDVDIFSFGGLDQNGIPFFSRRIGLSSTGQPVDLEAGAKLTGRVGRWNVGGLAIRQSGYDNVDDSMLMVGRVAANVLGESSLGAIMTYGDPQSNLDNAVVGADFRYRNTRFWGSRSLQGNLWYQRSETDGLGGDQQAWGAQIGIQASTGFGGSLSYQRFGEDFNPAMGFANRTGIQQFQLFGRHIYRPLKHPWLRTVFSFLRFENTTNLSGDLDTRVLFMRPIQLENHTGDQAGLLLFHGREVLVRAFPIGPGVIIPPGDYTYTRYGADFRMATERRFAPNFQFSVGEFYNGNRLTLNGGVDWRPNRHFYLGMYYEYNNIELPAGSFQTRLVQARANWAFNSKWSWVNLVQYDNFSNSVGINSRLRWNPRAGQDLYLVLNHNYHAEGTFRGLTSTDSEIILKYSHTLRF